MKQNLFAQHQTIKTEHPNALIFLYVGSFYEVLAIDAFIINQLLNFKISSRGIGNKKSVPMCGIPLDHAKSHARNLNKMGYKVVFAKLQSKLRFKRRMGVVQESLVNGEIDFEQGKQIWASYIGHLRHGHTYWLQRRQRR